jgi:hypothetical protein
LVECKMLSSESVGSYLNAVIKSVHLFGCVFF